MKLSESATCRSGRFPVQLLVLMCKIDIVLSAFLRQYRHKRISLIYGWMLLS